MGKATWIKVGATWKQCTKIWRNTAGTWASGTISWRNIAGTWKQCMEYIAPSTIVVSFDKFPTYITNTPAEVDAYMPLIIEGMADGAVITINYTVEFTETVVEGYGAAYEDLNGQTWNTECTFITTGSSNESVVGIGSTDVQYIRIKARGKNQGAVCTTKATLTSVEFTTGGGDASIGLRDFFQVTADDS